MENNFIQEVQKIQKAENLYTAFFSGTNMPFVTCSQETFNDQVWLFSTEEEVKDFGQKYLDKKILLIGVKLENKQFLSFFSSLYPLGVNEVVLAEGEQVTEIPLDKIVTRPDLSKVPEKQRPVTNPQLQLTGLYFMQEVRRPVPDEQKKDLKALEEEVLVNVVRGRYLLPLEMPEGEAAKEKPQFQIPCVKNKDGKVFQPVFTDMQEFQKFNKEKKFRPSVIPFDGLKKIMGENIEGVVINPTTMNLILLKEHIVTLSKE